MAKSQVVIKLGSSIVLDKHCHVAVSRMQKLAAQIKLLQSHGHAVTLVVSGAVAAGKRRMDVASDNVAYKQMAAGIGQIELMTNLSSLFLQQQVKVAQLLLTQDDLLCEKKKANIQKMLTLSAEHNTVVIVNENDMIELNGFGGNDFLACKIAELIESDYLLLLTDVEGVYNLDKKIMQEIHHTSSSKIATINIFKKAAGTGSMQAKINAAQSAARQNITTFITSGHTENILLRLIVDKEHLGTKVL